NSVLGCPIAFFFSSRRRHSRSLRDWSADVCSSDPSGPSGTPPPAPSLAGPRASRANTQVLRIEHVGAHDFDLGALAVHGRESGETPSDAPPAAGHEGESHPAPELDRGGR